jgi:D-alanyl-lipoteichoic acid acyltransferase DltB (MBOAT superfamily)
MLFNSIDFAIFLPIVFVLFWFFTRRKLKIQNWLLLVSSYVFYGWWDWRFLSLLVFSSLLDFFVGRALHLQQHEGRRKLLFLTSMGVNLIFLGFFKYYNFFSAGFSDLFTFFGQKIQARHLDIILPVGISFYTFQSMSYAFDIYRRQLKPTQDLVAFLAFVSFFPQLVAGPIERATHLLPQFSKQKVISYELMSGGLKLMLWGFFMKVVVADRLSLYVDAVYGHVGLHTGWSYMLATVFFALQIYGDFAGYSLIAIGCARLFGFDLMQNFNRPYFSSSFRSFWSRWHISLSTWFRDYLYIPLGGNRVTKSRNYFNLFITFLISGLWHGANWTFVVWGGIHGFFQVVERLARDFSFPRMPVWAGIFITFTGTCLAWIFFRAANISDAFHIIGQIFTNPGHTVHIGDKGIFAFSIFGAAIMIAAELIMEYFPGVTLINHRYAPVRFATILVLLVLIISLGVFDGSQFIYFQF